MAALDIGGRGLEELPDDLQNSGRLESLHCQGNFLQTIPKSFFFSCQNLKWLDLRNNRLTTLPSTIYRLRELRTLLLSGNLLETLPVQLGLLPHLTGLSISDNPLKDPPPHIVNQGTKMVLMYLQDKMRNRDGQDSGEEIEAKGHDCTYYDSSSEDSAEELDFRSSASNKKSDHLFSSEQQLRHPLNFSGPTMHQAVLHSVRTDHHGKPKYRPPLEMSAIHQNNITKGSRRKTEQREQSQAAERNSSRIKLPPMSVDLPSVETNKETLDISKALDKMKAQRGLEDWRKKAKMMRMKQQHEMSVSRLDKASIPRVLSQVFPAGPVPAPVGGVRGESDQDEERQRRRKNYKHSLEEQRKQAGIITIPTTDLEQAEDRLAEAMAMQDEMERKNREYRLRAFTGDLL